MSKRFTSFSLKPLLKHLFLKKGHASMACTNIKLLMTGPKGNSKFSFPETLNVPRGEAEGNIEGRGETKLTVSRGTSH